MTFCFKMQWGWGGHDHHQTDTTTTMCTEQNPFTIHCSGVVEEEKGHFHHIHLAEPNPVHYGGVVEGRGNFHWAEPLQPHAVGLHYLMLWSRGDSSNFSLSDMISCFWLQLVYPSTILPWCCVKASSPTEVRTKLERKVMVTSIVLTTNWVITFLFIFVVIMLGVMVFSFRPSYPIRWMLSHSILPALSNVDDVFYLLRNFSPVLIMEKYATADEFSITYRNGTETWLDLTSTSDSVTHPS